MPHPTVPAGMIPAADFARVAARAGVRETERTLIASGRLTRIAVGRRVFYRLSEIIAAAPRPTRNGDRTDA